MFRPLAFSFISMTCAWITLSECTEIFDLPSVEKDAFCSHNIYNLMESCKPAKAWPLSCSYWLNGWGLSVHKNWTWLFESCQSGGHESGWGVLLWNCGRAHPATLFVLFLSRENSHQGGVILNKSHSFQSHTETVCEFVCTCNKSGIVVLMSVMRHVWFMLMCWVLV